MRTTPTRAGAAWGAAALVVVVGAGPAAASTTPAPATSTAAVTGSDTVTWSLSDVQRTSAGIVVTGTAIRSAQNAGRAPFTITGAVADDSCAGIQVIDPTGRRVGLAHGDHSGCTLQLASDPTEGKAGTSFTATVADPGGSLVDVVLGGRLVATDVPLEGGSAASATSTAPGTWTMTPRSTAMTARSTPLEQRFTKAGASVAGQAVDLSTDVLFAFDSDVLGPDAGAAIDVAAAQLQAQSSRTVTITGHTDSQGDDAYNLGLSQRRAEAVRAALAAKLGAGWTLNATGVGEGDPVADETPPKDVSKAEADAAVAEAQRLDRRVAVVPG